jgi:hypothetical protein
LLHIELCLLVFFLITLTVLKVFKRSGGFSDGISEQ